MRILLAEDDPGSQMILRSQLAKLGHTVTITSNGKEALEAFGETHPQLVITDWAMPVLDGLELCRRSRGAGGKEYTYLIVLTASEKGSGFAPAMEAGADDFITKPCDSAELNVRLHVAERILGLQTHVTQLAGLVPLCPRCKKMRDYEGAWHAAETYLTDRTEASFSHGICPRCYETIIKPQLEAMKRSPSPE
jgi:sigma-B regulation protein RsbU (phosphoserine phosphatase)